MTGYLLIGAAALLWATLGSAARYVLRDGLDPLEIGFWRAAIAGALFALHAALARQRPIAARHIPAVAAFALVGVTVFYVSYFRAVEHGGAAVAAVLLYTAPAWVALAAAVWLGERMTAQSGLAVVLTIAGVALVAGGTGGTGVRALSAAALGWGLIAGGTYAVYYVFGKRYFATYSPALVFAYAMPIGALALLPMVEFAPKTPGNWIVLGFIAAVPTYVAYLLYAAGLARVEATRAATVATLEPLAAACIAFALWDEAWRPLAYGGAGLVLLGVLVSTTRAPQGEAGAGAETARSRTP